MIRINLLKPLEPAQAIPLILDEPVGRGKKSYLILGGLALIAVAGIAVLQFPSLLGGLFAHDEEVAAPVVPPVPAPSQEHVQPKPVTAQAVEETVRDLHPDQSEQVMNPTYADLVPSGKIEYQYYSSKRLLKDIKSVTPPDVGFAHFIFTPPGDFYVHGLAESEQDLQRFHEGLNGLMAASIRIGMNVAAGTHGKAKEFSFFGSVKYPLSEIGSPPDHTIPKAGMAEELKRLKTLATHLGIRMKEPKLISSTPSGALKKQVYMIGADCSFQQMQDLISDLHEGKSNLGLIKFSLNAKGDEKVNAELDIVAYVGP